jgi:chemotaxis protein MotB
VRTIDPVTASEVEDQLFQISVKARFGLSRRSDQSVKGDHKMSEDKFGPIVAISFACMLALAGCVSQQKYDALQTRYDQLNQTMSSEIGAKQMHIERLQNAIKVTVNDQLLFPSGDWQMPAAAQQTIAKMVPILAPMQQTRIVVNGYTDNVPIGPGLKRQGIPTNLVLSQKRADNVMQFMIAQGVNPSLISAQGFGDADPVASNDTPEGQAQNRRVELTLSGSGN